MAIFLSSKQLYGSASDADYDDCDNLTKKTAPGRAKSSVFYYGGTEDVQKKHQLLRAVAPEGSVSAYEYDETNGNLTASQVQNAETNPSYFIRTETTYTADGNYVATQTDARGKVVTTVTDPNKGTVTSVTDPKGQTVNYTYDTLRRVTNVNSSVYVNAEEGTRSYSNEYTYEGDTGLLSTVSHNTTTDDCDVTYTFGYDALGRKTTVNVGNVELSRNEYQDNEKLAHYGTLKKMTYGNNTTVENKYDDFNRVKAVHYNGENTPRYEYAYNAKGQVAHVTHNTTDDTGAAVKVVTESEYDLSDRPIRVKEHEGSKHVYTGEVAYNDEFGVLSEFREKVGENRTEYVTSFGYDDQNRPITLGYGSYGGSTTTYDALNRVTVSTVNLGSSTHTSTYHFIPGGHTDHGTGSVTGMVASITQPGGSCSYGYDDNGNIANATVNGKWASYAYDALGQLIRLNDRSDTRAGTDGSTWTYEYDQGGNILKKTMFAYNDHYGQALEVTEFEYEATWKDQLKKITVTCYDSNGNPTSVSTQDLDYDDIGNPTSDGTWTYTWQNGRQLASMSSSDKIVQFKYNASGLRTRKIVNGIMTKYTLHGKNVVHMTRGSDNLHFFYDAQNKPAVVVYNGTAYAYVKNLQGDIIAILDSAGTAVVSYTYDAWGVPTGTSGTMAATLGVLNPFRYRSYVYDEETGLYYLRSRYYSSTNLRFINSDRLLSGQGSLFGFNSYIYCINAPVRNLDSTGTECTDCENYGYTCYEIFRVGSTELKILLYQMDIAYPDEEPALPIDQAMENILDLSYDELINATNNELSLALEDAEDIVDRTAACMFVYNTINGLVEPYVEYGRKSGIYITNLLGRKHTIFSPAEVRFTLSYSQWYDELGIEFVDSNGAKLFSVCKRVDREVLDFMNSVLLHNGCTPEHHHFTSYLETCIDVMGN